MDVSSLATAFLQELSGNEFGKAFGRFDSRMQVAVPLLVLQNTWRSAIIKVGRLKQYVQVQETKYEGYHVLALACEFERGTFRMVLWVRDGRISGMSVRHQDDTEMLPQGGIR